MVDPTGSSAVIPNAEQIVCETGGVESNGSLMIADVDEFELYRFKLSYFNGLA